MHDYDVMYVGLIDMSQLVYSETPATNKWCWWTLTWT